MLDFIAKKVESVKIQCGTKSFEISCDKKVASRGIIPFLGSGSTRKIMMIWRDIFPYNLF